MHAHLTLPFTRTKQMSHFPIRHEIGTASDGSMVSRIRSRTLNTLMPARTSTWNS